MHAANVPRERRLAGSLGKFAISYNVTVLIREVLDPSSDAIELRVGWTLQCE